jgi:uncharacterized protein with PIN domain
MSDESPNLMETLKSLGLMRCQKCSGELRSIGWDEDEYGPHEQFVCDNCNPPLVRH